MILDQQAFTDAVNAARLAVLWDESKHPRFHGKFAHLLNSIQSFTHTNSGMAKAQMAQAIARHVEAADHEMLAKLPPEHIATAKSAITHLQQAGGMRVLHSDVTRFHGLHEKLNRAKQRGGLYRMHAGFRHTDPLTGRVSATDPL